MCCTNKHFVSDSMSCNFINFRLALNRRRSGRQGSGLLLRGGADPDRPVLFRRRHRRRHLRRPHRAQGPRYRQGEGAHQLRGFQGRARGGIHRQGGRYIRTERTGFCCRFCFFCSNPLVQLLSLPLSQLLPPLTLMLLLLSLVFPTYFHTSQDSVVVDGNLVTSRGPGTAFAFAVKLVEILVGKEAADKLPGQMLL